MNGYVATMPARCAWVMIVVMRAFATVRHFDMIDELVGDENLQFATAHLIEDLQEEDPNVLLNGEDAARGRLLLEALCQQYLANSNA